MDLDSEMMRQRKHRERTEKRLDEIEKRLGALEGKSAAGGGAGEPTVPDALTTKG